MSMTYRQLLRNLETMPESELDNMIRVNHADTERESVLYIDGFAYNDDGKFVINTDEYAFEQATK